ncbi:outer membrane protein [Mesorhizobium sp. B2-3-5]|uniref:outer membrane protein n=1 Tax=Mesorhizobium sp. B2-3-5 TaxID=2589958 RepID=UPI0011281E68|nr:outer membrane protein [Mesorhizobium sp. B2-3-5]TPM16337.1 porin family protein [Mesorhizobium sp. B2-3-5]
MKSVLLAVAALVALSGGAFAADVVTELPVAASYNWSGAYLGAQAGYGWGDSKFHDSVDSNPFDIRGLVGGVTAGYNYQFQPSWVVGAEADVSYSAVKGSFGPGNIGQPDGSSWGCFPGACDTKVHWYGTARARVGYAIDNLLIYGTGGLAFGQVESQIENIPGWYVKHTNVGWAAGAGAEYALDAHWTTKIEYMHIDLGWTNHPEAIKASAKFDAVRIGLNYKF